MHFALWIDVSDDEYEKREKKSAACIFCKHSVWKKQSTQRQLHIFWISSYHFLKWIDPNHIRNLHQTFTKFDNTSFIQLETETMFFTTNSFI